MNVLARGLHQAKPGNMIHSSNRLRENKLVNASVLCTPFRPPIVSIHNGGTTEISGM